jgi:hypothetical protein
MTNEEWKEFVTIVRNNSFEENKWVLKRLEVGLLPYNFSLPIRDYTVETFKGLQRFLIERVLYPIGNREKINCSCGSRNGYTVEMEDDIRIYQHTVCMNCDTIQSFDHIVKNKNIDEEEEECFVPTNGTWLSRLVQRLKLNPV